LKTFQHPQKGDYLIHQHYIKSRLQQPGFLFRFGAMSKSGKVKPRRQSGAIVAICDDSGHVVTQE